MKFDWNEEKNNFLKKNRNICFEDVVESIKDGGLLMEREHENKEKYPHQRIFVVRLKEYVYAVPYVISENKKIFLKTIYPSRKLKKEFLL